MAQRKGWLLLTNDDGIEAIGFEMLVKALHKAGYPVAVLAPSGNHSATGMRINLMKPMAFRERRDLVDRWELDVHATPVHLFELDGTPCDTMIVALDGGPNSLSLVSTHKWWSRASTSGQTFRRIPITVVRWELHEKQDSMVSQPWPLRLPPLTPKAWTKRCEQRWKRLIERPRFCHCRQRTSGRPKGSLDTGYFTSWPSSLTDDRWLSHPEASLLEAFSNGDMMLNVNAPSTWNGQWATTRLGVRWYRNAVHFAKTEDGSTATFTIGAASVDHSPVVAGDCDAVEENKASLSCLAVWPQSHPFCLG